eukprot:6166976-Pyramimonas_sp.AAC.1
MDGSSTLVEPRRLRDRLALVDAVVLGHALGAGVDTPSSLLALPQLRAPGVLLPRRHISGPARP